MSSEIRESNEPKIILQPMIDLFTGVDGAIAFAKLFHQTLPEFIKLAETNQKAHDMVQHFKSVAMVCDFLLKQTNWDK